MKLRIGNPHQFYAGLTFVAIGAVALWGALDYPMGKASRIGPGYFPFLISIVLLALGAAASLRALVVQGEPRLGRWPIVPTVAVLAGVVSFSLFIEEWGLVAAAAAMLVFSCYGRILTRPIELILLSVILIGFVVGLFVYLLGMPLTAF